MPIEYAIESPRGLIRTRCVGDVSFADVIAHFRTLETEPALPREPVVLLDFSDLTAFPGNDQIRTVAAEVRNLTPA